MGDEHIIMKEINIGEVTGIIHKHLFTKTAEGNVLESRNSFDETVLALMKATDFDRETSTELINIFHKQALGLVIDIKKNIFENNFKNIEILLHQLKGSAGTVKALEISNRALEAEKAVKILNIEVLNNLLWEIEELLVVLDRK